VRRWIDDILPLVCGAHDPLGVADFATHHVALDDAPWAYEQFQKKDGGTFQGAAAAMNAICLNCTLKRSPEESSTASLSDVVMAALRDEGVENRDDPPGRP
jgi:hypothetical protein